MTNINLGAEVRVGTMRCTVVYEERRDRLVQVVPRPKYWRPRRYPYVAVGGTVVERGRRFRIVAERARTRDDGEVTEEAAVDLYGAFWVDRGAVTVW